MKQVVNGRKSNVNIFPVARQKRKSVSMAVGKKQSLVRKQNDPYMHTSEKRRVIKLLRQL